MEPPSPQPTQLPLPLEPPDGGSRFPPPLAEVVIPPATVWRRLPRNLRQQVQQTFVRIWQEVLDDPQ